MSYDHQTCRLGRHHGVVEFAVVRCELLCSARQHYSMSGLLIRLEIYVEYPHHLILVVRGEVVTDWVEVRSMLET